MSVVVEVQTVYGIILVDVLVVRIEPELVVQIEHGNVKLLRRLLDCLHVRDQRLGGRVLVGSRTDVSFIKLLFIFIV